MVPTWRLRVRLAMSSPIRMSTAFWRKVSRKSSSARSSNARRFFRRGREDVRPQLPQAGGVAAHLPEPHRHAGGPAELVVEREAEPGGVGLRVVDASATDGPVPFVEVGPGVVVEGPVEEQAGMRQPRDLVDVRKMRGDQAADRARDRLGVGHVRLGADRRQPFDEEPAVDEDRDAVQGEVMNEKAPRVRRDP